MGGEQDSVFWRDRAACARPGMDPRWWFPESTRESTQETLAVCRSCPVVAECLRWVIADDAVRRASDIWGVAGGLTQEQRRRRRIELSEAGALEGVDVAALRECAGGCGRLLVGPGQERGGVHVAPPKARGMCARCYDRFLRAHREEFRAIVPVGEVRAEVA